MGLSAAERNKRKRDRKKREKEERVKQEEATKKAAEISEAEDEKAPDVEIEFVAEPILSEDVEGLRKFRERAPILTLENRGTENEKSSPAQVEDDDKDEDDENDENDMPVSKRKLRDMLRPSVADLKRRVKRPELVEAHDITAADPDFLIEMKSIPGTVPVPRHWGRKRKYLQGKVRKLSFSLVAWWAYWLLFVENVSIGLAMYEKFSHSVIDTIMLYAARFWKATL